MSKKNKLILILGAVAALGPLSIDMYLSAFPRMAVDLKTEIDQISLTLSTYFVGISLGQVIYGPLLDRYGRKKPLLVGFAIYFIAAVGCAVSSSVEWLIAMRFLMALGGCAGMVASRAIIRDSFEQNEIARAFSSLILVMGVAPILAPMLGGVILTEFGWRSIFWFLSAYAALIFVISYLFLGESAVADKSVKLTPKHIGKNYLQVLKKPQFVLFAITGSFSIASLFTYLAGSSFVVQKLMGFDELEFAYLFGFNALGFIAASQVNRFFLKRYDPLKISQVVTVFFGLLGVALIIQSLWGIPSIFAFLATLFLFMTCLGFINPNMQALALSPFKKNAGVASALVGSLRMVTGAISSILISIFHNETSTPMAVLMGICAFGVAVMLLVLVPRFSKEDWSS